MPALTDKQLNLYKISIIEKNNNHKVVMLMIQIFTKLYESKICNKAINNLIHSY